MTHRPAAPLASTLRAMRANQERLRTGLRQSRQHARRDCPMGVVAEIQAMLLGPAKDCGPQSFSRPTRQCGQWQALAIAADAAHAAPVACEPDAMVDLNGPTMRTPGRASVRRAEFATAIHRPVPAVVAFVTDPYGATDGYPTIPAASAANNAPQGATNGGDSND